MNRLGTLILVIVIVAAGIIGWRTIQSRTNIPVGAPVTGGAITVTARNYSFTPNEIRVKRGDQVKIDFKNEEGSHDLVIEGYNIRTPIIGEGEESSLEFTADKAGTYTFYCSIANHRQMGMVGTLVVE